MQIGREDFLTQCSVATSEACADSVSRTDLPGGGPVPETSFCPKGEMICKKYEKGGVMCKSECPILKARARKSAKNLGLAARVKGVIDVDVPFSFDEVAEYTSSAYAAMAGPDAIPMRHREGKKHVQSRDVLVIDDEAVVCDSLHRILGRQGHAAKQAGDAEERLAPLEEKDYGLVMLLLRMPARNGIKVQCCGLSSDVPILRISTFPSREEGYLQGTLTTDGNGPEGNYDRNESNSRTSYHHAGFVDAHTVRADGAG